jgi:hypothetical protein
MKLFQIDVKQLALSGGVGIVIGISILISNNPGTLIPILKSGLIGVFIGLLIQLTYNLMRGKIKNTLFRTNVIVCLNIIVVITISNLITGNVRVHSILTNLAISITAGVTVVWLQRYYYKKANKRLDERKLAQLEKNRKTE